METDAGGVVIDTSGYVQAIVYSHGHHGCNASVDVWQRLNDPHGGRREPRAQVFPLPRYRTATTADGVPVVPGPLDILGEGFKPHDPTETFSDTMLLVDGSRRVELIWAPSEVDDTLAVWMPDDGLLCGGAAAPGFAIPNMGTPLRSQWFTSRSSLS